MNINKLWVDQGLAHGLVQVHQYDANVERKVIEKNEENDHQGPEIESVSDEETGRQIEVRETELLAVQEDRGE